MHPQVRKASIGPVSAACTTASQPPQQVLSVRRAQSPATLHLSSWAVRLGGNASAPAPACSEDAERKVQEDGRHRDICWPLCPQQIGFSTQCLEGSREKRWYSVTVRLTGGSQEPGEERRAVKISFPRIKKACKCFSLVFESLTQ